MKTQFQELYKSFTAQFFPHLCLACRKEPPIPDTSICVKCSYELTPTDFHQHEDNEFMERFWGRVPLKYGAALYYFYKNTAVRQLTHQLKYSNSPKIGVELGERLGYFLKNTHFSEIDIIVPVPLHPKKLYERGYNQSSKIADGMSNVMNKRWSDDALIRTENTVSQTKKTRLERFENVKNAFHIQRPEMLKGKHILLVDDVLTTGATLEACALKLLELPNVTISMATLGITKS